MTIKLKERITKRLGCMTLLALIVTSGTAGCDTKNSASANSSHSSATRLNSPPTASSMSTPSTHVSRSSGALTWEQLEAESTDAEHFMSRSLPDRLYWASRYRLEGKTTDSTPDSYYISTTDQKVANTGKYKLEEILSPRFSDSPDKILRDIEAKQLVASIGLDRNGEKGKQTSETLERGFSYYSSSWSLSQPKDGGTRTNHFDSFADSVRREFDKDAHTVPVAFYYKYVPGSEKTGSTSLENVGKVTTKTFKVTGEENREYEETFAFVPYTDFRGSSVNAWVYIDS